jgi:hypothetical protein
LDAEGVALAVFARDRRLSRVYLLGASRGDLRARVTEPFRRVAARLGVGIAGSGRYAADPQGYATLAERIAHTRADGVVIDGSAFSGGAAVIKASERLASRVMLTAVPSPPSRMATSQQSRAHPALWAPAPAR